MNKPKKMSRTYKLYISLITILIIIVVANSACSSGLSIGNRTSDTAHAFLVQSAQIIDEIDEATAPEGEAYLVIKYKIENLQNLSDSHRQWTDNITLEEEEEYYDPTFIESMENQLWETNLLAGEEKTGRIAFTVPEEIFDFKLTLTFPVSETEVIYQLYAIDERLSINVDWVLARLKEIENNKKIPLIGLVPNGTPIMYQGIVLVPTGEIPQLFEDTQGLSDDEKRLVIENYLIAHGHCVLE